MRHVLLTLACGMAAWLGLGLSSSLAFEGDPPTPAEIQASLRLADPGQTVDLVAAEPDVVSPVAIAWDENGVLFVAEMNDYPAGPSKGRVRRLEDRDGDGHYERVTAFASGLPFPNGILPWDGGVLVTAAPDILFLRDNDGDGVADERRIVLTGFGEGNQQLRVNGLTWGLDNWVYGANGRSGGLIRRPTDPDEKAVAIDRHDFRFRPRTGTVEAIAGFSQFGLPRDDWGNRFPSWNTIPIRHVVLEDRMLTRNPFLAEPSTVAAILDTTDGGRVYSLAPAQPRFNAESVAFFNASCGPTIYRGGALGPSYRGNAFVCEPLTNLVHRRILEPDGPTFQARRAEEGREFLAATHPWFHPVNLTTGPDGALYVVDFGRELVEHPAFVPETLRDTIDFRKGQQTGRIWRIRRHVEGDAKPPAPPRLGQADLAELIAALNHNNGWWRDTAQRLLVQRRDARAVPLLERLIENSDQALARVQALWTLEGMEKLSGPLIRQSLRDPDPGVREQALRLCEGREDRFGPAILSLADDPDPRVRFRCALALGNLSDPEAASAMARIATRDVADPWTRLAILSGLGESCLPFLQALVEKEDRWVSNPSADQSRLLAKCGGILGSRGDDREIAEVLQRFTEPKVGPGSLALLAGLAGGLDRSERLPRDPESGLPEPLARLASEREGLVHLARESAMDPAQPADRRALALGLLTELRVEGFGEVLLALLNPEEPAEVQAAAARALAVAGDREIIAKALESWGRFPIATRRQVIASLIRSSTLAACLLDAVEADQIAAAEIPPSVRESLLRFPDPGLRHRVETLLHPPESSDRPKVVRDYAGALELAGVADRGATVFEQNCVGCHSWRGQGHQVGPDLSGIAGRPPARLLTDILDPNREVAPDYQSFVLLTRQGMLLDGLIAGETPSSIRLRRAEAVEETVLRSDVVELRNTGRSLMPEGLEQSLSPRDLADLIAFLRQPAPEAGGR